MIIKSIHPIEDHILIKPDGFQEEVGAGIAIPDSAKGKPQTGEVLAVGPGKKEPMAVKVGDRVMFSKYGGTEIEFKLEKCLFMRQSDIYAVLK